MFIDPLAICGLISPFILVAVLVMVVYIVPFEDSLVLVLELVFALVCMASDEILYACILHPHHCGLDMTSLPCILPLWPFSRFSLEGFCTEQLVL